MNKKLNNYHLKIFFYLLENIFAKNINEIAGKDTNHTPYKKAMYYLIETNQVIKTTRGFEFAEKTAKLLSNSAFKEYFKVNKLKVMKVLKTGNINNLFDIREISKALKTGDASKGGGMTKKQLDILFKEKPDLAEAIIRGVKQPTQEMEFKLRKNYKERTKDKIKSN